MYITCEKKKLLGRHNKDISLNTFLKIQKQPPEVFYKKAVVKKLANSKKKNLCFSIFLIQNIAKSLRAPILKNICEQLLLKCVHETDKNKDCS